jgi:hypothetical protein
LQKREDIHVFDAILIGDILQKITSSLQSIMPHIM